MNEEMTRLVAGMGIAGTIIGVTFLGQTGIYLLICLIFIGVVFECYRLLSDAPFRYVAILLALFPMFAYVYHLLAMGEVHHGPPMLSVMYPVLLMLGALFAMRYTTNKAEQIAFLALGLLFFGFASSYAIEIAHRSPHLFLGMFILLWAGDVCAYLAGSTFGKNRLAPTLSPGKTWEGYVGGLIATLLAAYVLARFVDVLTLYQWIIIGVLVSVFGTLGDLLQSSVKRFTGVKDSGRLFPGHGGFWDRFDSYAGCAAPVGIYLSYILY